MSDVLNPNCNSNTKKANDTKKLSKICFLKHCFGTAGQSNKIRMKIPYNSIILEQHWVKSKYNACQAVLSLALGMKIVLLIWKLPSFTVWSLYGYVSLHVHGKEF